MWPDPRRQVLSRRSLGRLRSSHFEHDQCAIIRQWRALRKPFHLAEHLIRQLGCGQFVLIFNNFAQSLRAKELTFAVRRFRDAVRMKHQDIARQTA